MLDELEAVCAGTGDKFSLLSPHVVVTVKPQRKVLVTPPTTDEDEGEADGQYVGDRTGEAIVLVCKDYDAAAKAVAKLAADHGSDPVKVTKNRTDDSDRYADAAKQNNDGMAEGSDA